ncbi:hypothetical protein WL82_27465 [Burkholderia ubonensis]|nr:hypothetical protein WL82_27465 [Burkholderia ubonensis]
MKFMHPLFSLPESQGTFPLKLRVFQKGVNLLGRKAGCAIGQVPQDCPTIITVLGIKFSYFILPLSITIEPVL